MSCVVWVGGFEVGFCWILKATKNDLLPTEGFFFNMQMDL